MIRKYLQKIYLALIFILLYAPIVTLVVLSFNQSKTRAKWGGFTLKWYKELFQNEQIMSAFYTTLIIAFISAAIATIIGTAAAIAIQGMKQKWKQKLPGILLGLVFLVGLGIFAYPTVADQWNKYHQSRAIASYEETVADMDEVDYQKLWEMAEEYNSQIGNNTFDGDAFSQEEQNMRESKYWSVLNPGDNGIMGYISIPKIEQRLPIYHGTSEAVLQIGAGHMSGTSLPVGGKGKHSVLAAHRGLPSAKLFTDIDQLVEGDKFYVHVLDKVLAYEVDQILPMVEKDDTDTLTEAMKNVEGEDYVTLFTCTPYGVNSHRLLVRGHSVPYNGEDDEKAIANESMLQTVKDYYMLYAILAVAAAILITVLIKIIRDRKVSRGSKEGGK